MAQPNSYRCDSVAWWAVQGGAGWLNLLRQLQRDGLYLTDQCIADLEVIKAVIENVIRRNAGIEEIQVPGGASGPIAQHFSPY